MAIQITITDAKIADNKLSLTIDTTNDAQPGDTRRMEAAFVTTMSAAEIKAQVDAAVRIMWVALSSPSWTITP